MSGQGVKQPLESALAVPVTSWRRQAVHTHKVDSRIELDLLNEQAGIPIAAEPLFSGPIDFTIKGNQRDGLNIWETVAKFGFRTKPMVATGLVSIRFVDRGFVARKNIGGSSYTAGLGQGLLTWFDVMQEETISADSSSVTATLPYEAISNACECLGDREVGRERSFVSVIDVNTVALAALRHNMVTIRRRMAATPLQDDLVTPLMEEVLVYQVVSAWPIKSGLAATSIPDPSSRAIRLAIDFIEANLANKIRVADIAAASGQSIRTLQMGFKKRLNCTLTGYLIGRRLDLVDRALHSADDRTIHSIASEWGFVHMSDFTQRYFRRFGRLPSAVRRIAADDR